MIPDELLQLDTSIKENRSFAIFRIPGEDKLYSVMQESAPVVLLNSIEELNGRKGFVIAPYQVSEACPIVLIQAGLQIINIDPDSLNIRLHKRKEVLPTPVDEEYSRHFSTFIAPIKDKQLKKIVLSRQIEVEKEEGFSPVKAFLTACKKYTRSYVYLCHTPQTGTWLGGTPEMLLTGEGNVWNTVAIAGTQPLQNGELPTNWDDKNLIEQMLVAFYIRTQLSSFDIHAIEKGPYTVRAGDLAHLRSDYIFSLPDNCQTGNLLKLLHPTPAVSGLPKEEAYDFILKNEGYDRKYYSGFTGWMNPQVKTGLYVNLRCMSIQEKSLTLYAGGGLLPSSTVEDEWKETEDKLQTMLYLAKKDNYVFE